MRYINKKTGAIIDSPSKIKGSNWEKLEEKLEEKKAETKPKTAKK